VYGRAPQVGNYRYMDGGLSAPFPVKEAFDLGATDVLVVVPHPRGRRWRHQSGIVDAGLAAWCHWRSPQSGVRAYRRVPGLFDAGMRLCEEPPGPHVYAAFPSAAEPPAWFGERDLTSLLRSARAGAADCRRLLNEMSAVV
jgi:predicted acylesterase/phospholipase RssA